MSHPHHRLTVMNLFRNILRQHKQKLPNDQRILADLYVKKEFKDHKQAKQQYINGFMKAWNNYLNQIKQQQQNIGKHLTNDELDKLSPEQRLQLEKLKYEATKINKE